MIDLAIMLAETGRDEYWDHAEAYGRNHLVESQFVDMEWMRRTPRFSQARLEQCLVTQADLTWEIKT